MKSFLYISFTPYALDKNSNFKYEIRNSRCLKLNKNNKNPKKNIIILFINHFYFINYFYFLYIFFSFFSPHINNRISIIKFKIRDVQSRVKRVKTEDLKTIMSF